MITLAVLLRTTPDRIRQLDPRTFTALLEEARAHGGGQAI